MTIALEEYKRRLEEIRRFVCRNNSRKYYRFRAAKFYGGIATADCVGCNLRCRFCWSKNVRDNFKTVGTFYSSEDVAKKLISIARRHNFHKIRISGNEPTLCWNHLINIIRKIPDNYLFIIETNGTLLDESNIQDLSSFENVYVRISFKAPTPESFERITLSPRELFFRQMHTISLLKKYKIPFHFSIPVNLFFREEDVKYFFETLNSYLTSQEVLNRIEFEVIQMYPPIEEDIRSLINQGLFEIDIRKCLQAIEKFI